MIEAGQCLSLANGWLYFTALPGEQPFRFDVESLRYRSRGVAALLTRPSEQVRINKCSNRRGHEIDYKRRLGRFENRCLAGLPPHSASPPHSLSRDVTDQRRVQAPTSKTLAGGSRI